MACVTNWDPGNCGCACTLKVAVLGCNSMAVGSGLTVDIKVGGSTIDTQATDSSGVATFSQPAGVYDVVVTDGRGTSRWATQTFASKNLACGGTTNVTLTSVNAGFHCWIGCGEPLKDTLNYTDANGSGTLVYDAANANGTGWYACASKASMASVVTALSGATCFQTVGTATVNYVIRLTATLATVVDYWGYSSTFPARTAATATCAARTMNYASGLVAPCIGNVVQANALVFPSIACPPALSLVGTMPADNGVGVLNPGSGSITITE